MDAFVVLLPQEFWFTCLATFLYFTAFIAMLVDFSGITDPVYQYWYDAMVAAGVSLALCHHYLHYSRKEFSVYLLRRVENPKIP